MDANRTRADLRQPPRSWSWATCNYAGAQPCRCLWRGFDEQMT